MNGADVVVVGAGLSGLACARELVRQGLRPVVLEASQRTGGRIGSDFRDGFILDRAFQVLQTWYPEARRQLDFAALDLRPFYPGALVRHGGRFHRVSDVWRRPQAMLEMLRSPVGTLGDKRRLLDLRNRALAGSLADLYGREETSAPRLLRQLGFSDRIIRRFFIPFFAGVFFEPGLEVSSRTFEFIFRAFAAGDTALPARGMQAIPDQLSAALPEGTVELGQHVTAVTPHGVTTADGRHLEASAVVLAADVTATARLLGRPPPPTRGTTCFHYAAERPPFDEPVLVLSTEDGGPVNSLLCPSNLSRRYAPPGAALVTVNVFRAADDPGAMEAAVRSQLRRWYGPAVDRWHLVATYALPAALPVQQPPVTDPAKRPLRSSDGLWGCGEAHSAPSIQWALHTGRRAGAEIAASLAGD